MIPLNHTLVRLLPKHLSYSQGVDAQFDLNTRKLTTEHLSIELQPQYEPAACASDIGMVVATNNPEIQVGDVIHYEYNAITYALGRWLEPLCTVDDPKYLINGKWNGWITIPGGDQFKGLHAFISDRFIIWLTRSGVDMTVNEFNLIEVREVQQSKVLLTKPKKTNIGTCILGEFKGKTVCYNSNKIYGSAQGLMYDGHKVEVILSRYVDGVIDEQ